MIENITSINFTDLILNTNEVKDLYMSDIITDFCEYSFSSFNNRIILLASIIIIFEVINFIFENFYNKDNIMKYFKTIDLVISEVSRIFIIILSYMVCLKIFPQYIFFYKYITIIFIVFIIINFILNKFKKTKPL